MKRLIFTTQSNFSEIRKADALYVDKTKQIYDCLGKEKYFFLSRPRRFGKSMLCSTLQALFAGQRELFKDLWIEKSDWRWQQHPVIFLNMGVVAGREATAETLQKGLKSELAKLFFEHEISFDPQDEVSLLFRQLIEGLHKKSNLPAVVIIDEYDKPLLDLVFSGQKFNDVHDLLKSFYGQLKHAETSLRLAFITGVYKFTQTSIFSDLNNLRDLTLDLKAGDLVGYTQEEVETNFAPEIETLALKENLTQQDFLQKLREQCNGYVFCIDMTTTQLSPSVYNSFAINTIFAANEFKIDIWFGTGTPTFLIKQLEQRNFEPLRIDNLEAQSSTLINSCEPEKISIETLLYFAGYVTIKSYDKIDKIFALRYPNSEIARAMAEEILPRMTEQRSILSKRASQIMRNAWLSGEYEQARQHLNTCLGLLHNKLYTSSESYFQTVIMFFFQMADMRIEVELGTNLGYADLVLWTKQGIFIIEIKMDRSASIAIEQIKARRYYQGLLAEQKPIFLVGMSCSSKERAIAQLTVVPL